MHHLSLCHPSRFIQLLKRPVQGLMVTSDQLKCSLINASTLISANVREAANKNNNVPAWPHTISILRFIKWGKKEIQFSCGGNRIFMRNSKFFERNSWECFRQANKTGFVFGPLWCQSRGCRQTKHLPRFILFLASCMLAGCFFSVSLNNSGIFHPHLPLNVIKLGCNYILSTYLPGT